jgi:hypothetical protein
MPSEFKDFETLYRKMERIDARWAATSVKIGLLEKEASALRAQIVVLMRKPSFIEWIGLRRKQVKKE